MLDVLASTASPESDSETRFASTGVHPIASSAALLELAFTELAEGALDEAPASLRRAKMRADAVGDVSTSNLARLAMAIEEALRGDFDGAVRALGVADRWGASPADVDAARSAIAAVNADHWLHRGMRARAVEVWDIAAQTPLDAVDARLRWLVTAILRARDPRSAWLVGPKAAWIETPEGVVVDFGRMPLLRRIWQRLMAAHETSPETVVASRELCEVIWPDRDGRSPVVRNRMKVAVFKMRDAGLRRAIERHDGGLRLAPGPRYVRAMAAAPR